MFRRTLTTLSAAAIALAGVGATPALAADDDDVARALAVILGLAVVGKIAHDRNKRDDNAVTRHRTHNPKTRHRNAHRSHRNNHVKPRPLPRQVKRRALPQHCVRTFRSHYGKHHMFVQRCLQRANVNINRLPQHCYQRVRTFDGTRRGFNARCMNRAGYRLARH